MMKWAIMARFRAFLGIKLRRLEATERERASCPTEATGLLPWKQETLTVETSDYHGGNKKLSPP